MFNKATRPAAPRTEHAEATGRKPVACSLIAENVCLRGDLASDGDVHLDGALQGDVRVRELTIGEGGAIEGHIEAQTVEIRGRVTGAITAQSIRLFATAHVEGDITHAQLAIEPGAHFEGRSLKFEPPAAVEPLVIAAAE